MKALFAANTFSDKQISELKSKGVEVVPAEDNLSETELIKLLQGKDIFIANGTAEAQKKLLEETNLKLVVFYGTGYSNYIDVKTAATLGIQVANTPKGNAYTVAEHAVALIMDAVKNITWLNNDVRNGNWGLRETWNLQGKTLGIIGMGSIGSSVARIMHKGFGMRVLYVSRSDKPEMNKELSAKKVDLEELVSIADVISLHVPLDETTENMLGEKEIKLMKPNAVLINTTRPEVVNPDALLEALKNDKIACVAFDAYYKEPMFVGKDKDEWGFFSLDEKKFIVTPHTAYLSQDAVDNMNSMVIENIERFLETGEVKYKVKEEV